MFQRSFGTSTVVEKLCKIFQIPVSALLQFQTVKARKVMISYGNRGSPYVRARYSNSLHKLQDYDL